MIEVVHSPIYPALTFKRGRGAHASRKHAHRRDSLSLVVSGRTEVEIGFDRFVLDAGAFVWIPAGLAHLCEPDTTESFEFAVLYVGRDVPYLGSPRIDGIRVGTVDSSWFLRFGDLLGDSAGAQFLSDALRRLRWAVRGAQTFLPRSDSPEFIDLTASPEGDGERGIFSPDDRFRRYRYFRARYSLGPDAVRQIRRVNRAIVMLQSGKPVSDVAVACGYYDQSHLVKAFRLYTGTVPSAYSARR